MYQEVISTVASNDVLFDISSSLEEVNERNRLLGWNVQYLQLKPGEYSGRMSGMDAGDTTLVIENIDVPTEILGEFEAGSVGLFLAATPCDRGSFAQDYDFCTSAFLLNGEGETGFILGENSRVSQFYIELEAFHRSWEMLAPGIEPFQYGYYGFLSLPPGFALQCYRDILDLLRGDYSTQQMKEEYVSSVLAALAKQGLSHYPQHNLRMRSHARARLLSRARDYIEANLGATIKLPELCHYAGASISTLSRLFREHYGISPAAYIRLRRMQGCYQWLRQANPAEKSVGDITKACGIKHPGRFASEYRQFFGESPKQTLGHLVR